MPPKDILGGSGGDGDLSARLRVFRARALRQIDRSAPHRSMRWFFFAVGCLLYLARVSLRGGFHVITYALFVHLLYFALLVVTPDDEDALQPRGGGLPSSRRDGAAAADADEFRPFVPKVQEFVVWKKMTSAVLICLFLTFFSFLDIPVYWPILVLYAVGLFALQMGGRVRHMIKYQYVPWSTGKPKFVPKTDK